VVAHGLVDVQLTVVQAPIAGVQDAKLAVAVSNAGASGRCIAPGWVPRRWRVNWNTWPRTRAPNGVNSSARPAARRPGTRGG